MNGFLWVLSLIVLAGFAVIVLSPVSTSWEDDDHDH